MRIGKYDSVKIVCGEREPEGVKTAVGNLARDFRRVLDSGIVSSFDEGFSPFVHRIMVGTAAVSEELCEKADVERLRDENGSFRKEAYLIQEKAGELLILGSDRRGTIYGIYEFCERWLGVSPWYFFADVPVGQKEAVEIPAGYVKADWPSVEYRGIFINDEEELEHWVQRYMGEPTIGVKTYEKIFELLLRLKLNYIWPAMHVNSFNAVRENGALADCMGIVVGTSHCDMLMRSNNREWRPWLEKKGYTDVEYDFSLPGRNREILKEYWRESIQQNREFEVSYTLGMRGIHDSGFEVRGLAGKSGRELLQAKIGLLESVIGTQETLLEENLGKETVKTFVPYKEVLELYDNGLQVPEDLTLIWVNDNYGHVRRYPNEQEKSRKGGNGLYYHNSYWAPPGGSYLFLCSIPLSQTRNELKKAYEEGIRKIWVTNFGAMKPLEQQISFYAAYAWEAGREGAVCEDEQAFLRDWIDRTFSGGHGAELAPVLTEFDQLTNTRKVEQMDIDVFAQNAYGDEAAGRTHVYEKMFETVNRVWKELPREERDAFFQMVAMKVHAAYYTSLMYYYADRSNLCMEQGKEPAAGAYTELSKTYDRARRSMLYYYNHVMSDGKWNGILTPEDFPLPRTAMHPACMPPLGRFSERAPGKAEGSLKGLEEAPGRSEGTPENAKGDPESVEETVEKCGGSLPGETTAPERQGAAPVIVTVWNDAREIVFTKPAVKWIELGAYRHKGNPAGDAYAAEYRLTGPGWIRFAEAAEYRLTGPDWIRFAESGTSETRCRVDLEERILFEPDWEKVSECLRAMEDRQRSEDSGAEEPAVLPAGRITVEDASGRQVASVPVSVHPMAALTLKAGGNAPAGNIEDDGRICVEAVEGMYCTEWGTAAGQAMSPDAAEKADMKKYPENGKESEGRTERKNRKELPQGWKIIPNLGRDSGSLLEAREPGAQVSWQITVLTGGSHLLELHRFPSLDSVGTIQIGVCVDQGQIQVLKTESNDEYRGTWKENIRNNVDKLYLRLPHMEPGIHEITFHAMSRYFAFSRFVIYTMERKENSLGREGADQRLPQRFDIGGFVEEHYGKDAAALLPRPVSYLPDRSHGDGLAMEDIIIQPSSWGKAVSAEELVGQGMDIFREQDGRLFIECAAALAESPYAYTKNRKWQWCNSPSHGETGLAVYIRQKDGKWESGQDAPGLRYRVKLQGGSYAVWVRAMMWGDDTSHFTILLDGEEIPEKELYGGNRIWHYSNEQVWKWYPIWYAELDEGEHELGIVVFSSRLRFEQIYMTRGEELPPAQG